LVLLEEQESLVSLEHKEKGVNLVFLGLKVSQVSEVSLVIFQQSLAPLVNLENLVKTVQMVYLDCLVNLDKKEILEMKDRQEEMDVTGKTASEGLKEILDSLDLPVILVVKEEMV